MPVKNYTREPMSEKSDSTLYEGRFTPGYKKGKSLKYKVPEHICAVTTAIEDGGRSIAKFQIDPLFTFTLVFPGV
jgi:hypothetical protein